MAQRFSCSIGYMMTAGLETELAAGIVEKMMQFELDLFELTEADMQVEPAVFAEFEAEAEGDSFNLEWEHNLREQEEEEAAELVAKSVTEQVDFLLANPALHLGRLVEAIFVPGALAAVLLPREHFGFVPIEVVTVGVQDVIPPFYIVTVDGPEWFWYYLGYMAVVVAIAIITIVVAMLIPAIIVAIFISAIVVTVFLPVFAFSIINSFSTVILVAIF